jgi:hypothetical protein
MMPHPRIPWSISEPFEPDLLEADDQSPGNPDPAGDGLADEESSFWDQMIFPL